MRSCVRAIGVVRCGGAQSVWFAELSVPLLLLTSSRTAIPGALNILVNDELRLDRSFINSQSRIPSAINRRPRPPRRGPPAQLALRGNATGNMRAHWQRPPDKPPLVSMLCSTQNAQPRRSTTLSLRYCFWVRRRTTTTSGYRSPI
jgi:hypothetical protein